MATNIDYTSRDFNSLRQSLLDYAQTAFPDWQPGSEGDFGVLLVELLAYLGDVTNYYVDRAQNEAYLSTATRKGSVLNIAKMLGYKPGTGAPATGSVTLSNSGDLTVTVPAGTAVASDLIASIDSQVVFETDSDITVSAGGLGSISVTEGLTQKDPVTGGAVQIDEATGQANQEYKIPLPRVYSDTVQVYIADTPWQMVDNVLASGATDQVFEVYNDEDGYTWIHFGDGINGAIPAVGLPVSVIYRTGWGSAGNLAAGAVTTMYDAPSSLSSISVQMSSTTSGKSTSIAMGGGADPETIDEIRNNAPKTFFSQQRAVTIDDFVNFALSVPGVAKASAIASFFSSVSVYIAGPDGTQASNTLVDKVQTTLQDLALAGVSVTVGWPQSVAINITVDSVQVWPTYSNSDMQAKVQSALESLLAFTNVDLGSRLTVSQVYSAIMAVDGVRYASVSLMARNDATQSGTADIQFQASEFPTVGTLSIATPTGGIG